MSYTINYKNGSVIYDYRAEDIQVNFMTHSFDRFRIVYETMKTLVPLTESIYDALPEKAKTKVGALPNFDEFKKLVEVLDSDYEQVFKRLLELKEIEPTETIEPAISYTLEELEAKESEVIAAIEAKELEELASRRLIFEVES